MNAPLKTPDDFRNRTIGAILVEDGRLRPEDAERVVKLQAKKGLTFGAAAKKLGMLSEEDIQYALARQFDHPYLMPSRSQLSKELVAAFTPDQHRWDIRGSPAGCQGECDPHFLPSHSPVRSNRPRTCDDHGDPHVTATRREHAVPEL